MVHMRIAYEGEKHCQALHQPSKSTIETDAPKDNNGRGERFSPTDLVGAALGSCMLTVMGISAEKENLDMKNSSAEVIKEMTGAPRKIKQLSVKLHLPKGWDAATREKYQNIALNCPVKLSLHPDVQLPVEFIFDV